MAAGTPTPTGTRVLIIDDAPSFRGAAAELLAWRGYDVVGQAADSASGLEAARRLRPDAVLVDLGLDGGQGLDLCARLREELPSSVVLLVTADDEPVDLRQALDKGACGLLLKSRLTETDLSRFLCKGSGLPQRTDERKRVVLQPKGCES